MNSTLSVEAEFYSKYSAGMVSCRALPNGPALAVRVRTIIVLGMVAFIAELTPSANAGLP
jgi:hypothetical protein